MRARRWSSSMAEAGALPPVITIDGPSGAGKGTLSAALAQRLGGWRELDSGALYRTLAWDLDQRGLADQAAVRCAARLGQRLDWTGGQPVLDGAALGEAIRTEEVAVRAARLAAMRDVRLALLDIQRACRRAPGLVADGRDMGSVVFPDAVVKIYLDADPATRARRRRKQLRERGRPAPAPARTRAAMQERDALDRQRAVAPLRMTADMRRLDCSGMSAEQVREQAWAWVSSWAKATPRAGA